MPVSSVEKEILELFRQEKKPFTISQVARLTGHDRRTVGYHLALLHQSRNLGMINHGVKKKYFLPDCLCKISSALCPHIIIVINRDFSVRWVNEPFLEVLGCTIDTVRQVSLRDLEQVFPDIYIQKILSNLTYGQTQFSQESVVYNDQRLTYIFSFSAINIEDEINFFIITGQDITEQERIKSAFDKKEQSYEALIKNIPGIVLRRDIESNSLELYSDKTYFVSNDIPLEQHPSGISVFDSFLLPGDRDRLVETLQSAISFREEYEIEYQVRNTHGALLYLIERGRPVVDPSSNSQYIDAIIMDITGQKEAENWKSLHAARLQALLELNDLAGESPQAILDYTRKAGLAITGSKYALLGFLNEGETLLTIHTWSDSVMADCRMNTRPVNFPVSSEGIWGELVRSRSPVIMNDFPGIAGRQVLPEGHVQIKRFLALPVIKEEKILAVLAVADKPSPYQEDDLQALTLLGHEAIDLLQKKTIQDALFLKSYAIESSLNGIALADPDGVFTDVNPAFLKIFGFSDKSQVIGRPAYTLWADHDKGKAAFNALLRDGCWVGEVREGLNSQQEITLFLTAQVIKDPSGRPVALMGSFIDVTERKRAEERLKKQESMQQLLMNLATQVINVPLEQVDAALQEMMGAIGSFTSAERVYIFQHNFSNETTSNTQEWCATGIKPEIENLQEIPFSLFTHVLLKLQSGEIVHFPDVSDLDEADPVRTILENQGIQSLILLPLMQEGISTGFVGFDAVREKRIYTDTEVALLQVFAEIISNVLSREAKETALKESEKLLTKTQEIAHVGSWRFELETRQLFWSDKTYRIFGISPERYHNPYDLYLSSLHPDDLDLVRSAYFDSIRNGMGFYEGEYRIIHQETGEIRFIHDRCIHERDSQGTTVRSVGMIQDITERKGVEMAIEQSNQKLRILTRITRNELITMLDEMQYYLHLVADSPDSSSSTRYLTLAQTIGDRIRETVGFTRDYEIFGVSLSGWQNIGMTISAAIKEIPLSLVSITAQIPPTLEVYADPIIRKVFVILMENAIRHGISVSEIRFMVREHEGDLFIICEDDGVGIPQEKKRGIFTHSYGRDAGFGLYLVKEILSITGLFISETGEEGSGARFRILVPKGGWRLHATGPVE